MRLIDADALIEIINNKNYCGSGYQAYYQACSDVFDEIESSPTIEAEPVRRGRWVLKAEKGGCLDYHVRANCSECGWDYYSKDGVGNPEFVFSAFCHGNEAAAILFVLENAKRQKLFCSCPNCGAKMDGKEGETE